MILDIWKDKTLDYMTAANAIFHFLKDLYSLIQYFSIFFYFVFSWKMKHQVLFLICGCFWLKALPK